MFYPVTLLRQIKGLLTTRKVITVSYTHLPKNSFSFPLYSGKKVPEHITLSASISKKPVETLQKLSEALEVQPWEFYYFSEISNDEKKEQLKQALDKDPKLVKILYSVYKSIIY